MLNPSRIGFGVASVSFILIVIVGALFSLFVESPSLEMQALWKDPYLQHITLFSIKQALLSTLISVGLAVPCAHAISRRAFKGRHLLLKLFSMTLVLPVLVGVFGILAIYGNNGLLAKGASQMGLQWSFNIYGLSGILLAHVFFNLPFSIQLLVQALEQVPSDQKRLAHQLGMKGWNQFRLLEWPYLRKQLPHNIGLVFMLCFTSFATVMALGGGPSATSIELAIYQAIRFEFDLQTAALLALWQLFLCALFQFFIQKIHKPLPVQGKDNHIALPVQTSKKFEKIWDFLWIGGTLLFVLPPLIMVVLQGLNPQILSQLTQKALWEAAANSVFLGAGSAFFAFIFGSSIVLTSRFWKLNGLRQRANALEMSASLILVVPSVVLGTGLFLMLRHFMDVFSSPVWLVLTVNTFMALPFVIKTLSEPAYQLSQNYQNLCNSLGIKGLHRLRLIEWRALKAPISKAIAVSFVLSLGDLGAIALVGSQDYQTLPLYLFRLMGSYQMEGAAAVSLVLLLLSLSSYIFIEAAIKGRSHVAG